MLPGARTGRSSGAAYVLLRTKASNQPPWIRRGVDGEPRVVVLCEISDRRHDILIAGNSVVISDSLIHSTVEEIPHARQIGEF